MSAWNDWGVTRQFMAYLQCLSELLGVEPFEVLRKFLSHIRRALHVGQIDVRQVLEQLVASLLVHRLGETAQLRQGLGKASQQVKACQQRPK